MWIFKRQRTLCTAASPKLVVILLEAFASKWEVILLEKKFLKNRTFPDLCVQAFLISHTTLNLKIHISCMYVLLSLVDEQKLILLYFQIEIETISNRYFSKNYKPLILQSMIISIQTTS